MGDTLPEELYRAWASAMGLVYGSDETPSFHNLPTDTREAWKAVTEKAKHTLGLRFANDMRDATATFGAEQAMANLLEARLGR